MFHSFLLLLSVLMGGTAAGPAESESGGGPAPDAAHVAAPDAESDAVPVAAGGGCFVSDCVKKRTIHGMLLPRTYEVFLCACCEQHLRILCISHEFRKEQYEYTACSECQAPICSECKSFMSCSELERGNSCRWCLASVYPLRNIVLDSQRVEDIKCFQQLNTARQNFDQLYVWFQRIFLINRKFDFSKIWWIEMTGWRFFADGDWFFQQKLEHEFNVVMASMLFNNSKRLRRPVPQHFGMFYKQFREDPTKYLFQESRQITVMHSMAFKIQMKMKRMEMKYCDLVLRRVESKFARLLQNGLGVNPQPPKDSEDSEDDY